MIAPVRKAAAIAAIKSSACDRNHYKGPVRWLLRQQSVPDAWAVLERRENALHAEWRCWVLNDLGLHSSGLLQQDRLGVCNDGPRRVPWRVVRAAMRKRWGI